MDDEIRTDQTISHPHDPKYAPHPNRGEGVSFAPYVSVWERLPDAIRRIMEGERPKERARADLCRAVADRTVNIRCKLEQHATRHFTSKDVLDGNAFEIPTEIKPEELDWERSGPLKPWFVRRKCYSVPLYWHLASIEVCSTDVTKSLCLTEEQHQSQRGEAIARTSGPSLEGQERPFVSNRRSTAKPRTSSSAGTGRRRGARPQKFEQTKAAMRNDIQQGPFTVVQLESMREKDLEARYAVSRDTARKARVAVLSELSSRQIPTNDK
jgi:hypothetical protein